MKRSLLDITVAGELEEIEFKVSFGKEGIETLCAFANNGGTIFVGVEVSGRITGTNCGQGRVQPWISSAICRGGISEGIGGGMKGDG